MNALLRALLTLLLVCPALSLAQTRLLPVDEAASVPDFFSFRAQLQAAVARRDAEAVLSVLSSDVKLSFGGDSGAADFEKIWNPHAPDSSLWETLAAVLSLGGTFGPDGSFTAPYVFARWPQDKDAFMHMAAIGSGVRVRSAATIDAPAIDTLDFSIVELVESSDLGPEWVRIKLPPSRSGFVAAKFLRSPIDYRANFAKMDGRWKLVFFLAGD